MEMISVVVPVYNVEDYIEDCVESLLKQSYKNFEVIFVDDGSKDSSIEKIKNKIEGRSELKIVTKTNGGLSSARNYGLKFTQGEFVTFVDSDDYLDKDFLLKMYDAIGSADICCCGYNEVSEKGEFLRNVKNEFGKDFNNNVYKYIVEAISFIPNAWGKLYRRKLFNKLVYPEGMLFEDYAIAYKVFYLENVKFLDEALYFYRIRHGSIMRDFNENLINHKFIILTEMHEFLASKGVEKEFNSAYVNSYLHHGLFVTSCIIINQKAEGTIKYLKKLVNLSDGKVFNIKNIIKSNALSRKVKLYLILLRISPELSYLLKSMQNRLGDINGEK